jgi:alanine dehydrogenase
MIIGTVREIKNNENRVGLTPDAVKEYVKHGHKVLVEQGAGLGSNFSDSDYELSGAKIVKTAKEVWDIVDLIVKVKEPLESEYVYFRKNLVVYTYLHLAANESLVKALLKSGVNGVAYETIELEDHQLPCLKPMSQVAGRLAVIEAAKYLQTQNGGKGILINGVPGTRRANALVIGAGVVGENSIASLVGLGANVTVLDVSLHKLELLDHIYGNKITTLYSNETNLITALKTADIVISSVLLPGAKAPKLIKKSHYQYLQKGTVVVDVAIDQGGTTESSRPTSYTDPIFVEDGIIFYCVANMPGAVALTSTIALNNASLRYGLLIADFGLEKALKLNKALKNGLNTYQGKLTYKSVAEAFDLPYYEYI